MHRLLLVLAALLLLPCARAAAQAEPGRIGVGITILEPVSTDRSGPPTVRRRGEVLDVALPAAAATRPHVTVTMEHGGRVAECRARPGAGEPPRQGVHRAACPAPAAGEPARIRVVIVPVS